MELYEIIAIILIVSFLLWIILRYLYRRIKKLPTGECAMCSHSKSGNKLLKQYHKKYGKCCCKTKK